MEGHVSQLVTHCERLMREKQALLRAQHAEDPTPHRLDMLEDDVGRWQRYSGALTKLTARRRE
jgi:hypothetical protein